MNLTICQYNENVNVKDSCMCFESKENVLQLYIEFVPLLKKDFAEAKWMQEQTGPQCHASHVDSPRQQ